jgi:hypothetical protein
LKHYLERSGTHLPSVSDHPDKVTDGIVHGAKYLAFDLLNIYASNRHEEMKLEKGIIISSFFVF